jgi:hypothetical protein
LSLAAALVAAILCIARIYALPEVQNPNQQPGGGFDARSMLLMTIVFVMAFFGLTWYRQHNQASAEQQTVVENELYRITFSNQRRTSRPKLDTQALHATTPAIRSTLSTMPPRSQFGYPLSLYTYDGGTAQPQLTQALFVPSATGLTLPRSEREISFDYSANGLHVHKEFRFDQSYVIHASATVTQNGNAGAGAAGVAGRAGRRCDPAALRLRPGGLRRRARPSPILPRRKINRRLRAEWPV